MFNYQDQEGELKYPKIVGHAILLVLALIIVFGSFGTISAGERGVKTRFGAVRDVFVPGFYMKLPIIEKVVKITCAYKPSNSGRAKSRHT